jgi:hypothetical protein
MERLRQTHIKLDQLTQWGWGDAADSVRKCDKNYGTTELEVPAVVQLNTDNDVATPPLIAFAELMESPDTISQISQTLQWNDRPRSSPIRLGCCRLQSKKRSVSLPSDAEPNLSRIKCSETYWTHKLLPLHFSFYPITIQKSDSYEEMLMVYVSAERYICKLQFLKSYQVEKQFVNQFWYVSTFTWLQWPNCETW